MKITLAFYSGKGTIVDNIIRIWTKSKYSHVEMIIKDKWVSSNPSNGGVTIRELRELSTEYEYVELEVDGRKLKSVLNFIEEHKNAKYDWLGVFMGNVFNVALEDKDKFFCSEMMVLLLKIFGYKNVLNIVASETSPGELYLISKTVV